MVVVFMGVRLRVWLSRVVLLRRVLLVKGYFSGVYLECEGAMGLRLKDVLFELGGGHAVVVGACFGGCAEEVSGLFVKCEAGWGGVSLFPTSLGWGYSEELMFLCGGFCLDLMGEWLADNTLYYGGACSLWGGDGRRYPEDFDAPILNTSEGFPFLFWVVGVKEGPCLCVGDVVFPGRVGFLSFFVGEEEESMGLSFEVFKGLRFFYPPVGVGGLELWDFLEVKCLEGGCWPVGG
jgi:hypothetical protein